MFLSSRYREDIFTWDFYLLLSGRKGEVRAPSVPAVFQVSLAQNNPFANVAYFAVARPATLHYLKMSIRHSSEDVVYVPVIQRSDLN